MLRGTRRCQVSTPPQPRTTKSRAAKIANARCVEDDVKYLPMLLPPGLKVSCSCALKPHRCINCVSAGCTAVSFSFRRGVPSWTAYPPGPRLVGEFAAEHRPSGGDSTVTTTRSCFSGVRLSMAAALKTLELPSPEFVWFWLAQSDCPCCGRGCASCLRTWV